MEWKIPPKIKVHEALGCIGDKRIEMNLADGAKVYSSSRGKFYTINYNSEDNSIMCNDNASYWTGALGYPSIAFLMLKGVISYNPKFTEALKGIKWKDMNQQFKNDWDKMEDYAYNTIKENGLSVEELKNEVESIYEQIKNLKIKMLGNKIKPPVGY